MPSQWDDKTLEAAITGAIMVRQYQLDVPYHLTTPEQQQRFAQAKEQGYLKSRAATGTRFIDEPHPDPVFNAYERWCEIHQLPAVNILPGRQWASLSFDLIYTKKVLSPATLEQVKRRLSSYMNRKTYIGRTSVSVPRVPVDQAEALAKELLALYQQGAMEWEEA